MRTVNPERLPCAAPHQGEIQMAESTGNRTAVTRRGPWHNNYFRSHFSRPEQIRQLLILAMSNEQLNCFDLGTIRVQPSTLSDVEQLTEKHTDLIVSCSLKGGGEIIISIVIEAKSSADSGLMRQLLAYMARLYSNDASAVLALTVFHGKSRWRAEKSFHAFEHARLPEEFESQFRDHLIDFRSIFVSLGDPDVSRHLLQLPLRERLALQVLSEIWDATAASYVKWLQSAKQLPEQQQVEFIKRTYEYLLHASKAVTPEKVREAVEANLSPGDEKMAEIKEYSKRIMSMTMAEAEAEFERQGIEKGKRSVAQHMLLDGVDESMICKYFDLSKEDIRNLKNGTQS